MKGNQIFVPIVIFAIFLLTLACGTSSTVAPTADSEIGKVESVQVETKAVPTEIPPVPTNTINPNLIEPGTYIVGTDIKPGYYYGLAGIDFGDSCYWERLKDLSGNLDSILANNNASGQFYIEVLESDSALKTDCQLTYLSSLPEPVTEFPQNIKPGIYLVGIEIQPGKYKGQAGTDITESCYWERLKDLKGSLNSILANDNAQGQYYVQVSPNDFALNTGCDLEWVGK
jgi:hypothetical protein